MEDRTDVKAKLAKLVSKIEDLLKVDSTHDELGTVNGFHELQDIKNKSLVHAETLVSGTIDHVESITAPTFRDVLKIVSEYLNFVDDRSKQVEDELLSIVVFYESGLGGGFLLEEAVFEGTSFDDVEDLLVAS